VGINLYPAEKAGLVQLTISNASLIADLQNRVSLINIHSLYPYASMGEEETCLGGSLLYENRGDETSVGRLSKAPPYLPAGRAGRLVQNGC